MSIADRFKERRKKSLHSWKSGLYFDMLKFTEEFAKQAIARGWNRAALARELGVSRSYITQIFRVHPDMKLSTLYKLAFTLGIRPVVSFSEISRSQEAYEKEGEAFKTTTKSGSTYNLSISKIVEYEKEA